ncbi:hypothetical protein HanRHA438_Chr01g0001181 [Helianthus annuus]|nr:hypothetical protein HanRHA438_Chr01g0001181 [Helianthus annuus]
MVWLVGLFISCLFKLVVVINQGKFPSVSCSTPSKSPCSTNSVPSDIPTPTKVRLLFRHLLVG